MPKETGVAVEWALQQSVTGEYGTITNVSKSTPILLVDKVREYFNENSIEYETFSYNDLVPYITE